MSEFSESYHLRADDQQAGVALLKRAGLAGFVFPPKQGWVTVLAEGSMFEPNHVLIAANEGVLLYYTNAEDHGWSFTIIRSSEAVSHFSANWEADEPYRDELLNAAAVCDLAQQACGVQRDPAELDGLLKPDDPFAWVETGESPAVMFARFIGLTNFEWLSYDYYARDHDPEEAAAEGIVAVE